MNLARSITEYTPVVKQPPCQVRAMQKSLAAGGYIRAYGGGRVRAPGGCATKPACVG